MNILKNKVIRICAAVVLVSVLTVSMSGCVDFVSKFYTMTTEEPEIPIEHPDSETAVIGDFDGNKITVTERPKRIMCVSPIATEILMGIGASKQIIAIDIYSALLEEKPEAETFTAYYLTYEQVLAYNPDLIIYSDGYSFTPEVTEKLKNSDIKFVRIPDKGNIETAEANIRFLAAITLNGKKGENIIKTMREEIKIIETKAEYLGITQSVYIEYQPTPNTYTCGGDTIISELCRIVGLVNIYDSLSGYAVVDAKDTITANPDLIISVCQYSGYKISEISEREGWGAVNAVKNGDVKRITAVYALRPTQNIIKALYEIAALTGAY